MQKKKKKKLSVQVDDEAWLWCFGPSLSYNTHKVRFCVGG